MTEPSYRLKTLVACPVEKSDGRPLPFVGLEDIGSGTGSLLVEAPAVKSAPDSVLYAPGDILFSKLRPYLAKSFMATTVGSATGELLVLRPRDDIDRRFLLYSTLSAPWLDWADTTSYGSKMPRTSWEAISEYRIVLPPLDEQRRIADFLDAETRRSGHLSALIMRTRATLATKRNLTVTSTLGLDEAPRMRTLKHAVRAVGVGIVITPARWYVDHGGIPAIRGMNVKRDGFDTRDLVCISHEGHRENIRSRLSAGDVVVVRTGQAGTAAVVPPSLDGCNCIDTLIIRPGRRVDARYLAHYINSDFARERIAAGSVGTIQSHFNVESMKNLAFPIMDRQEQGKRAARLDDTLATLDSLDAQLDRQLTLLAERRQSLITAAVTGQLDVTTARGVDV